MLWHFNVDAFLEQYDETSMHPHIFASLCGYPSKWAYMLDEGKDISVWDLLMHMEKTFGNKHDYDAMIRTLSSKGMMRWWRSTCSAYTRRLL